LNTPSRVLNSGRGNKNIKEKKEEWKIIVEY